MSLPLLFNTKKERRPSQRKKTKKIFKRGEIKFWKILKKSFEAQYGFVEEIMDSIYKSKFWTKCPYCKMEFQYPTFFKNGNRSCPISGKYFIMKDDQGNSQLQPQKLESELGYYKESNTNL